MNPEPLAVRADPPAQLEVPPAHLELSWRPLQLGDVDALHALVVAVEEADGAPVRTSREELVETIWSFLNPA